MRALPSRRMYSRGMHTPVWEPPENLHPGAFLTRRFFCTSKLGSAHIVWARLKCKKTRRSHTDACTPLEYIRTSYETKGLLVGEVVLGEAVVCFDVGEGLIEHDRLVLIENLTDGEVRLLREVEELFSDATVFGRIGDFEIETIGVDAVELAARCL